MTATAEVNPAHRALQASTAIMEAFKGNPSAAQVYLSLRQQYAQHIIRAARCLIQGDESGNFAAQQDAVTTQRTARALLIGLGVQTDQPVKFAHSAAFVLTAESMHPAQLVTGASAEPRAVYVDEATAEDYTLSTAPERVIWSQGQRTAYLFTEGDHRRFCQRTGRDLRPLQLIEL